MAFHADKDSCTTYYLLENLDEAERKEVFECKGSWCNKPEEGVTGTEMHPAFTKRHGRQPQVAKATTDETDPGILNELGTEEDVTSRDGDGAGESENLTVLDGDEEKQRDLPSFSGETHLSWREECSGSPSETVAGKTIQHARSQAMERGWRYGTRNPLNTEQSLNWDGDWWSAPPPIYGGFSRRNSDSGMGFDQNQINLQSGMNCKSVWKYQRCTTHLLQSIPPGSTGARLFLSQYESDYECRCCLHPDTHTSASLGTQLFVQDSTNWKYNRERFMYESSDDEDENTRMCPEEVQRIMRILFEDRPQERANRSMGGVLRERARL